jgi:PAS domain S-box-containing protein
MLNPSAGRKRGERWSLEPRRTQEPWPIAAVADPVVTTDDSWIIRSWNKPMEELFGWSEGTVVGRDLYEVLGLGLHTPLRRDLPRALLNHGRWEGDVDGIHRDGDPREIQLSVCFLRGTEDAPAGILAVARPRADENDSSLRVLDGESHSEPGLPGLFVLHYQPEVDLQHLSVVSCEALLRWHHPGLGLLSPGGFLGEPDLAARLEALGAWTFFAACRQAATWTTDHDVRVTANISGQQLADRELAGRVRLAMTAAGVEPGRFGVEVTAQQLASDPTTTRPALAELAETGALVLLDDVRSVPALDAWAQLPLSGIKLGRSLIDGVASNPDRRAAVEATVQVAHDLGLWVTAEGVESADDLDCVRDCGCDGAFGFLLLHPCPAGEMDGHFEEPLAVRWDRVDAL